MKMILRKEGAFRALALIFVLSMLLGAFAPFLALNIDASEGDLNESDDGMESSAPYVTFGGEELRDGGITKANQGEYKFVDEDFTFLRFTPTYPEGKAVDPSVTFEPGMGYGADEYKYVSVVIRTDGGGDTLNFVVYYIAGRNDGNFAGEELVRSRWTTGGGWQVVTFDLTSAETWSGEIKKLRLDMTGSKHLDASGNAIPFDIGAVIFSKSPQDVYDGAFDALTEMYKPKQALSDFEAGEANCFSASGGKGSILHSTKVTVRDGNVMLEGVDDLSDPYAGFKYQDLMASRGVSEEDRLTTADFNNTVIRFRAGNVGVSNTLELFLFTGDHFAPFKISDGKGGSDHVRVGKAYTPTKNYGWQCLSLKMDEKKNEAGWQGAFNGFRIDWCKSSDVGGYMEISDILFYADDTAAAAVTSALNTVKLPLPRVIPTEHPFLTPLQKSSEWIMLDPTAINRKLSAGEGVSCEVKSTDGVKSVKVNASSAVERPCVEMDVRGIDVLNHKYLSVLVRKSGAALENFVLYYKSESGEYAANGSTAAVYEVVDGWQVLTFLFDERAFEGGDIVSLRLDFAGDGKCEVGDGIEIASMIFSVRGESAYDAAYYMLSRVYVPVQILTDFTSDDAKHFDTATSGVKTTVSALDGDLVYSSTAAGGDPGKMFSYTDYAKDKDINPVTTKDFRYTVVRYRSQGVSSNDAVMEMFIMTGDAKNLYDMASVYEVDPVTGKTKLECRHCARAAYSSDTGQAWEAVCLDMAAGDGYETSTHLKYGWDREDGNYTFQGFRMDWCKNTGTGSMLQISDIIFYQDKDDAVAMSAALSAVSVPVYVATQPDDDFPLDDELETDVETETKTETETDTDVETETETDTDVETETVPDTDVGTGSDTYTDTDTEIKTETELGTGNIPDEGADEGAERSQLPFYLACGALVLLSVASVIAVLIIKKRSAT